MKAYSRLALLAAVFIVAVLPVRAQENVPDPRLDQKITYSAYAASLQTVADDLSKKTGIILRVGSGERDWKSKERKVHVSFQNVPLGVALNGIVKTLGFELRRTGEEQKWSYRLWQTNRSREYEQTMLTAQTEAADREITAIRETVMKDADSVQTMSMEDAAKLREKDPWLAYLGGTTSGRAYAEILRELPPETKELVLRGRKVTLEASELPPDLQQALSTMSADILKKMVPAGNSASAFLQNMTTARIVFQPITPDMGVGDVGTSGMAGLAMIMGEPKTPSPEFDQMMKMMPSAGLGKGMPMIGMPLTGSGSMMGRAIGTMMLQVESGMNPQMAQQQMLAQMQTAQAQSDSQLKKIVPTPKPTDPALLAEIEPLKVALDLTGQKSQTEELVKQLSKKTPLSYVVEHYPEDLPLGMFLPAGKQPLYKVLDSLQMAGLTWEYGDGVVRIRPKDWAVQRSYDVPQSMMEAYQKILKDKGFFDLDDLATVAASLTDGQIQHRFMKDKIIGMAGIGLMSFGSGNRTLLRLYGELTPGQKAKIKTAEGLPFDQLNESQWQRLAGIIEEEAEGAGVGSGRIKLAVEENKLPDFLKPQDANANDGKADSTKSNDASKADSKKPAQPEDAAQGKETPPETGPRLRNATFTLEIAGENGEKPQIITRALNIPGKEQIAQIKGQLEQMQKDQEKRQEDEEKAAGRKTASSKPTAPKTTSDK
jgi:hypothetical protein